MELKAVEILDRLTSIPALAIKMSASNNSRVNAILSQAGYYGPYPPVLLVRLADAKATSDPYSWENPLSYTMRPAHIWIGENFDAMENGAAIDAEFLRGETSEPRQSNIDSAYSAMLVKHYTSRDEEDI
jgi:hypothetical protein